MVERKRPRESSPSFSPPRVTWALRISNRDDVSKRGNWSGAKLPLGKAVTCYCCAIGS